MRPNEALRGVYKGSLASKKLELRYYDRGNKLNAVLETE